MTLEMVAAQIDALTHRPSTPELVMLRVSLDNVRPPIPFDLEPEFDAPAISVSQMERKNDLHRKYERVRLWHRLVERLNNLKE